MGRNIRTGRTSPSPEKTEASRRIAVNRKSGQPKVDAETVALVGELIAPLTTEINALRAEVEQLKQDRFTTAIILEDIRNSVSLAGCSGGAKASITALIDSMGAALENTKCYTIAEQIMESYDPDEYTPDETAQEQFRELVRLGIQSGMSNADIVNAYREMSGEPRSDND